MGSKDFPSEQTNKANELASHLTEDDELRAEIIQAIVDARDDKNLMRGNLFSPRQIAEALNAKRNLDPNSPLAFSPISVGIMIRRMGFERVKRIRLITYYRLNEDILLQYARRAHRNRNGHTTSLV